MFEQLKKYKVVIFAALLLVLSPIIVFMIIFHDRPWGDPSDFANFATYFNNMLMPFLTFGTVVALVLTLKNQKRQLDEQKEQFKLQLDEQRFQFQEQRKSEHFENYVQRFEMQYVRFLDLSSREFPCPIQTESNKRFNLNELALIDEKHSKHKLASSAFKMIEKLRDLKTDEITDDIWMRAKIYTEQIKVIVENAAHTLHASFSFAEAKNVYILLDLMDKSADMIRNIYTWRIINSHEASELIDLIEIPDYLRDFKGSMTADVRNENLRNTETISTPFTDR